MKRKIIVSIALIAVLIMGYAPNVYARGTTSGSASDLGFFGGITQGVALPLTTQRLLLETGNAARRNNTQSFIYKEMIWLAGPPVEFEGTMTRSISGQIGAPGSDVGTASVTYQVRSNGTTAEGVNIFRNITFDINWNRTGSFIVETYNVRTGNWREEITVNGVTYTLIPAQSHFNISILRDATPGVTYYSGDISKRLVYTASGSGDTIIHEVVGQISGFTSAWSSTETHRLNGTVFAPDWAMEYQVVPSVSVSKELQYAVSEPTLISFAGNYREVTTNQSGLNYVIHTLPNIFYGTPASGGTYISVPNTFEQLTPPNLSFLRGHWAYGDIRRLFAMGILDGSPEHFIPNQGVSRGEFMQMLSRAVKLPLDPALTGQQPARGRNAVTTNNIFPDVWRERPDFPYLMAMHEAGVAIGRGGGHFQPDEILRREEAYALALRMLGLSNLGLVPTPITPFVDDGQIGDWARRDLYAASRIGLILPDDNGMIHPRREMYKAEAAALVNRLIEYLRIDLQRDYTENIINFMN